MADNAHLLISKIVSSEDITPVIRARITPDWFDDAGYRQIFKFLMKYYQRYGESPTAEVLHQQAPNFKPATVRESYDYYITEFRNQRRRALVVDAENEVDEALLADDPVKAANKMAWAAQQVRLIESDDVINSVSAADITPRRVQWIWKGRIPKGKITVVAGDAARGKTTLAINLIGRLSDGRHLPLAPPSRTAPPMKCLIMTAEDDYSDTVVPRLLAAHANLDNVEFLDGYMGENGKVLLTLPEDIDSLRVKIQRTNAKILLIDPFNAFLNGKTDSYRDSDIRRVLHPLSKLAEETSVAILLIFHLNKNTTANALQRIVGSVGIGAAARSVLFVAPNLENEDERIMAVAKVSNAAVPSSLTFRIEGTKPYGAAMVRWTGQIARVADELVTQRRSQVKAESALHTAEFFLENLLLDHDGSMLLPKILVEAESANISEATLRRAKESLGVQQKKGEKLKHEGNFVYWYLPEQSTRTPAK